MANRSTQRTKRRPEAPRVSAQFQRQSMAENHSGSMMFDNEFMGGQSTKRARSRALEEERKKPVALRQLTYPLFATSSQSESTSADGSSFQVSTEKIPMHIPQSATNVYASLLKSSVPYKWPNYTEGEDIVVKAEVPRTTTVGADPVPNPLTVSATTPLTWEVSNDFGTGSAGAVNWADSLGTTNLTRTDGELYYQRGPADSAYVRLNDDSTGGVFDLAASDAIGSSLTAATYAFTATVVFALKEDQAAYSAPGDDLLTVQDADDASKSLVVRTTENHLELRLNRTGAQQAGAQDALIIGNILDHSGKRIVLSLSMDYQKNLEIWVNGVRTRVGKLDYSAVDTLDTITLGDSDSPSSYFLLKEFRVFPGVVLDYANLRSEHDTLMRKYDVGLYAKSHLIYCISVGDIVTAVPAQTWSTDLATDLGAPANGKDARFNVTMRSH